MHLFSYGTLMKGFRLHHNLEGCRFIGQSSVAGDLYDLGSYPALVPGRGTVIGEVYEVPDHRTWKLLDAIEGSAYTRRAVPVVLPSEKVVMAQVYWYNRSVSKQPQIMHGDYRLYRQEKQ